MDYIMHRRVTERWHTMEWVSRPDDRVDANGHRIWPEGSGALMYDSFTDYILNGQDNLTYREWEHYGRPMARDVYPIHISHLV